MLAELQLKAFPRPHCAFFLKLFLLEIQCPGQGWSEMPVSDVGTIMCPVLCWHSDCRDEKGKEKSNKSVKSIVKTEVSASLLLIR